MPPAPRNPRQVREDERMLRRAAVAAVAAGALTTGTAAALAPGLAHVLVAGALGVGFTAGGAALWLLRGWGAAVLVPLHAFAIWHATTTTAPTAIWPVVLLAAHLFLFLIVASAGCTTEAFRSRAAS